MKVYLGFDDTDTRDSLYGTGKLVRWFQSALPEGFECLGVVRQQLFVCDAIPYTSHNSAACLIAETPAPDLLNDVIERAANHLARYAMNGSDPGLCVATELDASLESLIAFGHSCTRAVATQRQALEAAKQFHLSGHGGTDAGIIGAAAAVGLTVSGWSGRFIEFGDLRNLPDKVLVSELNRMGIEVVSMERDAKLPAPNDTVITNGWLRPRLLGHRPVLFASPQGKGQWKNIYLKRKKRHDHLEKHEQVKAAH
ncbi:MAG: hypothetical protein JSW39_09855 [Desulfobacterales bacterium]|nr:MAG: hypothetical protein JSW39_09855 [Desulfobacterales bacterium]